MRPGSLEKIAEAIVCENISLIRNRFTGLVDSPIVITRVKPSYRSALIDSEEDKNGFRDK